MITNQHVIITIFLYITLSSDLLSQGMGSPTFNASRDTSFHIQNKSNHSSSVGLLVELPELGLEDEPPGFTIKSYGGAGIYASTEGTFSAIRGRHVGFGAGVYGSSSNGVGIYGDGDTGNGIYGTSTNAYAIKGLGRQIGGVKGESNDGTGVFGTSESGVGVRGESESESGIVGFSGSRFGIYGSSTNNYGIVGISTNAQGGKFFAGIGQADIEVGQRSSTGKGIISSDLNYNSSDLQLESQDDFTIVLDKDDSESAQFEIMTLHTPSSDTATLQLFEEGGFGFEFQYDGLEDKFNLWSRKFSGNEAKRMTWLKNGNVGISSSTPSAKLHIEGGSDATLTSGGHIITGSTEGENIVIDNNEIIARDNGVASQLFINKGSGETVFGGKVRLADNNSSNEAGQIRYKDGKFEGYDGSNWLSLTKENKDYQIFVGPGQFYRNDDDHLTELGFNINTGATARTEGPSNKRCIIPINLPVGAQITEVVYFYKEDLPDGNMTMDLISYGLDGTPYTEYTDFNVTTDVANGPVGWTSAATNGNHTIAPFRFYALTFWTSSTAFPNFRDLRRYKGARITYTLP